ncbi:unnamed protein product [Dovyalis caffra]|uniref:Uncharacterized protein n=1 Tax=Dovyalis caffra TaxID=77055 RepID=A0AAV1SI17_9ROSI|nr:unnamed protein product [Dovyalis caffra]
MDRLKALWALDSSVRGSRAVTRARDENGEGTRENPGSLRYDYTHPSKIRSGKHFESSTMFVAFKGVYFDVEPKVEVPLFSSSMPFRGAPFVLKSVESPSGTSKAQRSLERDLEQVENL